MVNISARIPAAAHLHAPAHPTGSRRNVIDNARRAAPDEPEAGS